MDTQSYSTNIMPDPRGPHPIRASATIATEDGSYQVTGELYRDRRGRARVAVRLSGVDMEPAYRFRFDTTLCRFTDRPVMDEFAPLADALAVHINNLRAIDRREEIP